MAGFVSIWSQADIGKKAGIVVGVTIILLFLIGATFWVLRTDYEVLFAGMDPRDASAVISELERMKIDYRIEESGSRITVPSDVVHQVRLKLMGSEIPIAGTVGLEIFNDSDFGMTEFAQKINFQRALQGELTRTIMSLKEVKYARVHLVMPESGLFKAEGKKPSASVILFLKNGTTPDERMISGIQRLVSSSVPELKAEMVSITDQRGIALSKLPEDAKGVEAISKRLKKQQEFEDYYVGKIINLLYNRYGSEELRVSVNVSLSYDQVSVTRKGVLGAGDTVESGVLRRRESSFGSGDRKGKENGTKTTEVEYELGHSIEQTVEAPGRILKISVGILLPRDINDKQRQEIKDMVSMVIGFDATRGDDIAIYSAEPLEQDPEDSDAVDVGISKADSDKYLEPHVAKDVVSGIEASSSETGNAMIRLLNQLNIAPGFAALAGMIFVLCLILLVWFRTKSDMGLDDKDVVVLSEKEREEALAKIREWLSGEENKDQTSEYRA